MSSNWHIGEYKQKHVKLDKSATHWLFRVYGYSRLPKHTDSDEAWAGSDCPAVLVDNSLLLQGNSQLKKCRGRYWTICQMSSQCIPSMFNGIQGWRTCRSVHVFDSCFYGVLHYRPWKKVISNYSSIGCHCRMQDFILISDSSQQSVSDNVEVGATTNTDSIPHHDSTTIERGPFLAWNVDFLVFFVHARSKHDDCQAEPWLIREDS